MTVFQARRRAQDALRQAGAEAARFEADSLLCHALQCERTALVLEPEREITPAQERELQRLLQARAQGEPLQYLLGEWEFYGLPFQVGRGVLIPRPETEWLAEFAIEQAKRYEQPVIYDLCAGSGCISLAVAYHCPHAKVYAVEKYKEAFFFLSKNRERYGLANFEAVQGDILELSPQKADIILSNPPYIPAGELAGLQREVRKEPRTALDGGADGLDFYRVLAQRWLPQLQKDGVLAVECGEGQGAAIAALFGGKMRLESDFRGVERFLVYQNND